jgi:hypothetical protein
VDPRDIPLEQFTPADRINVMEWLLSHDQVIFMLYDKMFPRAKPVHVSSFSPPPSSPPPTNPFGFVQSIFVVIIGITIGRQHRFSTPRW